MKTARIPQEVLVALSRVKVDGKRAIITAQLERPLYVATNKVLEALGGKWSRKDKVHVFDDDPTERIDAAMMNGDYTDPKKEFELFETPEPLARELVQRAGVKREHNVLEPSAGRGRIAKAIFAAMAPDAGAHLDLIEIQPSCRAVLEAIVLHLRYGCVRIRNFLPSNLDEFHIHERWDRIVMNPPFSGGQDIAHVRRAYELLAPGGRLVSVMGAGVSFRQNKIHEEFRSWLAARGGVMEELPDGSFAESGTQVGTVVATIERRP